MNKNIFIFILACFAFTAELESQEKIDGITYSHLVNSIARKEAPRISGKYIIFTADGNKRHTGIAFEHEGYKYTHSFKKISAEEIKTGLAEPFMFYIMPIPENLAKLRYRIVTDGLWTSDPLNSQTEYDYENGFTVSALEIPIIKELKTRQTENGINFVYMGEPGRKIGLAGSFNNWDPFMYFMKETEKGLYELELPLPKGVWLYSYFVGFERKHDPTNPHNVYSTDGKVASVIEAR